MEDKSKDLTPFEFQNESFYMYTVVWSQSNFSFTPAHEFQLPPMLPQLISTNETPLQIGLLKPWMKLVKNGKSPLLYTIISVIGCL